MPNLGMNVLNILYTRFRSIYSSFEHELDFLALPKITGKSPPRILDRAQVNVPRNIKLADPTFHRPSEIDLLIGAEIFYELLCTGQVKCSNGYRFLKTRLGWIAAGCHATQDEKFQAASCNLATKHDDLNDLIPKFWELETLHDQKNLSKQEVYCETNFQSTVQTTDSGRITVSLPFNERPRLGDSETGALKRFKSLERQLNKHNDLKIQYHNFIKEYIALVQMKKVDDTENLAVMTYYLPHHGVINTQSSTTRLRVVFDGSAKSSNGKALNDFLFPGPKLQPDLFHILLRFREHTYALTADISKMFRQILLHPDAKPLHRILWRFDNREPINTYELQTVTYGTTCASYLAVRAIQHLAEERAKEFPAGSKNILKNFYVDDMLCGTGTIGKLETKLLLGMAGISLHKWASNCPHLLPDEPGRDAIIELSNESTHKTLGIRWRLGKDTFEYSIPCYEHNKRVTKRTVMSYTCSIFDPLGTLAPVVITAKLIIQQLWKHQLGWDESLPADLHGSRLSYRSGLRALGLLRIPRKVVDNDKAVKIQLHGFSDASEGAYGACVYVVRTTDEGITQSNLLCAKSREAPLKTQSIPRLELCGAALLAEIMTCVTQHMPISFTSMHYWSDPTVVIHWIRSSSASYKTFVANRVGQIQQLTNPEQWRHVPTRQNPADMITRGIPAAELLDNELWWNGPKWLLQGEASWPAQVEFNSSILLERKTPTLLISQPPDFSIFLRYSRLVKLVRIVAYCRRFLTPRKNSRFRENYISAEEYQASLIRLIRLAQLQAFKEETKLLKRGQPLMTTSKLLNLNPFLDEAVLVRVGGPYQKRRPVLPPKASADTATQPPTNHANNSACP